MKAKKTKAHRTVPCKDLDSDDNVDEINSTISAFTSQKQVLFRRVSQTYGIFCDHVDIYTIFHVSWPDVLLIW